MTLKPLGHKAYGHIPHLPGSRMGPADHHCHEGQARICTEQVRDKWDRIIVQEKLDGSCCSVAMLDSGEVVALGRAGFLAATSPYKMHHVFAAWVDQNYRLFRNLLTPGLRIVGEWIAQAHGTRYIVNDSPFIAFDVMRGQARLPFDQFNRVLRGLLPTPLVVSSHLPISVSDAMAIIEEENLYGAVDPIEGVVYRCERKGEVEFVAKWVRHDKVDGKYLPTETGGEEVWNWTPAASTVDIPQEYATK